MHKCILKLASPLLLIKNYTFQFSNWLTIVLKCGWICLLLVKSISSYNISNKVLTFPEILYVKLQTKVLLTN
jgi:hypothetical protein